MHTHTRAVQTFAAVILNWIDASIWRMSLKVHLKNNPFFPVLQVAPLSGSLNGDLLMSSGSADLPPKPLVRGSMSVAQADYPERPEVIARRETGSSTLPLKTEVPLHLFSTTNQLHKPVGVQQQIPTKLAAINSSKGKGSKSGKASHRTDSTGEAPGSWPRIRNSSTCRLDIKWPQV